MLYIQKIITNKNLSDKMEYSKSNYLFFILIFQLKWIVQYRRRQRTLLTHSILQTKFNPAINHELFSWKRKKNISAFRYPFLLYRRLSRPNQPPASG